MPDTKFGSLESLVGRTFERDGATRLVATANARRAITSLVPGGDERQWPLADFCAWLSGAKEVGK